ncbi:MAG: PIN domain-containing protein [Candidatus Woesearchaeota archaeon]
MATENMANAKKATTIKVILDTNFLLIPYQFHVDIFSEIERVVNFPYELCITEGTMAELEKLSQSSAQKERLAAKLGLELVKSRFERPKNPLSRLLKAENAFEKQKNLKIVRGSHLKHNDDAILETASSEDVVATQDKLLKQRLKEKKIRTITLKQKKYLAVD